MKKRTREKKERRPRARERRAKLAPGDIILADWTNVGFPRSTMAQPRQLTILSVTVHESGARELLCIAHKSDAELVSLTRRLSAVEVL